MAETDIHLDDIGTIFRVTAVEGGSPVNISTQTALEIIFTKADGTRVPKTAVLTADGTDGEFEYIAIAGDLDQVGNWQIQGKITLPTWIGHTAKGEFIVAANL